MWHPIDLLHAARIDTPVFLLFFLPVKAYPRPPYSLGRGTTCAGGGAVLQSATCGMVWGSHGDVGMAHHQIGATMSDNLRDRIAAVIAKHHNYPEDYLEQCLCPEWNWQDGVSYSDHVSDAVIRELRLSVDRGVIIGCDGKCATNECGCPRWDET